MLRASSLCVVITLDFWLRTATPAAAAQSSPALTCSATRLSDGSVSYRLSQPPSSTQCDTCWEDRNKTVLARDSNFEPQLIKELTNQSITMDACHDYLHYTQDCLGNHEEAHCTVNCSELLGSDHPVAPSVNSTLTCLSETWCPDPWIVGLGIFLPLIIMFGSLSFYWWRRRRAAQTISYTPGVQQNKPDTVLQMDVIS